MRCCAANLNPAAFAIVYQVKDVRGSLKSFHMVSSRPIAIRRRKPIY